MVDWFEVTGILIADTLGILLLWWSIKNRWKTPFHMVADSLGLARYSEEKGKWVWRGTEEWEKLKEEGN